MRTIRISDEVWNALAREGRFGETPDVVLRRVFRIRGRAKSVSAPRTRIATQPMNPRIAGEELVVSFQNGASRSWSLPRKDDKAAIRRLRDAAVQFVRNNAGTEGQVAHVMKVLTSNGYHVSK